MAVSAAMVTRVVPPRVRERIERNVTVLSTGCIVSRYSIGTHGYPQVGWGESGRTVMMTAARALWTAIFGDPGSLTVDHICHVRRCVNIEHLRLLPNSVNAADNGQMRTCPPSGTTCLRGHPKVVKANGQSYCRECLNAFKRKARAEGRPGY